MSVRFRTDRGKWEVRYLDGERHRSKSFPATDAGERDARRFDARVHDPTRSRPEGVSPEQLRSWAKRWLDVYGHTYTDGTLEDRAGHLDRNILPYLGRVRLRDLTRGRVATWRRDLLHAGKSPKTVNSALRVLSACLSAAVDEGLIEENRALRMRKFKTDPVRSDAIPLDVIERVRAVVPTGRDQLIVSLMAYAGLRPQEIRALQTTDLDGGLIHVRTSLSDRGGEQDPKTSAGRRDIPITAKVERDLVHANPAGLVVTGDKGGPLNWRWWSKTVWRPALREADVARRWRPYDARHTYASQLIRQGLDPASVAYQMGHARASTTLDIYTHRVNEDPHDTT